MLLFIDILIKNNRNIQPKYSRLLLSCDLEFWNLNTNRIFLVVKRYDEPVMYRYFNKTHSSLWFAIGPSYIMIILLSFSNFRLLYTSYLVRFPYLVFCGRLRHIFPPTVLTYHWTSTAPFLTIPYLANLTTHFIVIDHLLLIFRIPIYLKSLVVINYRGKF